MGDQSEDQTPDLTPDDDLENVVVRRRRVDQAARAADRNRRSYVLAGVAGVIGVAVLIGVIRLATRSPERGANPKTSGTEAASISEADSLGGSDAERSGTQGSGSAKSDPTVTEATAPATTAERGELGSGETVTIAFAGDSSFQGLDAQLKADASSVLRAITPLLSDADLTMVNLEAAVGTGGTPENKAFTFQTPVESLHALSAAGVDVVTMANNHGMDFGPVGFRSSLDIRASKTLPIVGIGESAVDAYSPHITEVKGQRVGFIGANDVFDAALIERWTASDDNPGIASAKESNEQRLLEAVAATRKKVDTLIVFLHYGRETQTCPNPRQVELASVLADAGADIVVGSHAHRLQGVGFTNGRFVAYGLGNFIFRPGSAVGRETGVLKVSTTGRRINSFEWKPAVIDGGVPIPLTGQRAAAEMQKMERLASCAGVSKEP